MPNQRTGINPKQGGGPWTFDAPSLSSGEAWTVNLDRVTHKGKDRYFTPWLPMDEAKVFNDDVDNQITVTFNGRYDVPVKPDTIERFADQGIRYFTVTNDGSTAIAAADVQVSVVKNPWNADKQARSEMGQPMVSKVVEKFTGVRL